MRFGNPLQDEFQAAVDQYAQAAKAEAARVAAQPTSAEVHTQTGQAFAAYLEPQFAAVDQLAPEPTADPDAMTNADLQAMIQGDKKA